MNSTQVSTEPINKDLGNTETSNQETIPSKNTGEFSGQISTDSGIEITIFRFLKDTSIIYFLQANTYNVFFANEYSIDHQQYTKQ